MKPVCEVCNGLGEVLTSGDERDLEPPTRKCTDCPTEDEDDEAARQWRLDDWNATVARLRRIFP